MSIRIALLEILHNKRFAFLFLLNLMIGLLGFVTLDGFKNSFRDQLQGSSKKLQTADLSVSARRPFTEPELASLRKITANRAIKSELTTLYSMAASDSRTALVELEVVDELHPFYGWIEIENSSGQILKGSSSELNRNPHIWVAPEILLQFRLKLGSTLKLGDLKFTISGVIKDDTGMSWAGASYAPRIYMGKKFLNETGLIKEGSTAWRRINYKITDNSDVAGLEKEIFSSVDNSVRVKSYLKAGQDNGRLLRYLTDYLGLVSLVALFLSGLGTFYLFRSYLQSKQKEVAILLSIGMPAAKAINIYLVQLVLLGFISSLLSLLFSIVLLPQGTALISQFSPVQLEIKIGIETIVSAVLIGTLTPILLCLPLLFSIKQIKPAELFQEYYRSNFQMNSRLFLGFIPALLGTYFLSIWQSRSFLVGSIFFLSMLLAALVITLLGQALLSLASKIKAKNLSSRLALSYLHSNRGSALSCFLALSLSALLMNLIPQLESTLIKELQQPEGETLPSLFLFDIQEQQEAPLRKIIHNEQVQLNFMSPMVSARFSELNGKEVKKIDQKESFTREDEREKRSRNRGVNLSYRTGLLKAESIVEGEAIVGSYDFKGNELPKISLEQRYANRMKVSVGDTMTFNIQGLPIEGKVVNLRKVKWNTFQPNFFILLQPGVIDDAPKTFLAALPPLTAEKKNSLQIKVVDAFPNISMIDVSKLVKKLGEIISQMSNILKIMAWLSVLAGLIVTFSIANHQTQQRIWDVNLLKILGSSFSSIQGTILKEFFLLSAWAGIVGVISGFFASWMITKFVFDGLWSPNIETPIISLLWLVSLCLTVSFLASHRVLKRKPRLYL